MPLLCASLTGIGARWAAGAKPPIPGTRSGT